MKHIYDKFTYRPCGTCGHARVDVYPVGPDGTGGLYYRSHQRLYLKTPRKGRGQEYGSSERECENSHQPVEGPDAVPKEVLKRREKAAEEEERS